MFTRLAVPHEEAEGFWSPQAPEDGADGVVSEYEDGAPADHRHIGQRVGRGPSGRNVHQYENRAVDQQAQERDAQGSRARHRKEGAHRLPQGGAVPPRPCTGRKSTPPPMVTPEQSAEMM